MRRSCILWGGLLVVPALAQQPPETQPQVTFRVETRLVEIEVRVTGKGRKPVSDLKATDFTLKENGEEQKIATFEYVPVPGTKTVTAGVRAEESGEPQTPAAPNTAPPVRMLLITEGAPGEQTQLRRAITQFIDKHVTESVQASLNGGAFTNDRDRLHATLAKMVKHPLGYRDRGSGEWQRGFFDETTMRLARLEVERINTVRAPPDGPNNPFAIAEIPLLSSANQNSDHPNIEMRPPLIRRIDQEIRLLSRRAYLDYLRIVREMAAYPGKKVVVLFRSGLRIDPENQDLLDSIASASLRSRVSFYTVYSPGLSSMTPGASMSAAGGRLLDLQGPSSNRQPFVQEFRHRQQAQQSGLRTLAERTGGRAVLNSNELGDVFTQIEADFYGYYLLGYYPRNVREKDRFRKIKVRVDRKKVKVRTGRGYFEPVPFPKMSKAERNLHLQRAVHADTEASDFPISVGYDVFRDSKKNPVVVFGVSAPMGDLISPISKKRDGVQFVVAIQAIDLDRGYSWNFESPVYKFRLGRAGPGQSEPAQPSKGDAYLDYTERFPLPPGRYEWRIVVRNEITGRVGRHIGRIQVPAFDQADSPSTLLLASRLRDIRPMRRVKKRQREKLRLLAFRGGNPLPEFRGEFEQGQKIFFLYDLYNVRPAEMAQPAPIRLIIQKDEAEAVEFQAVGDFQANRERNEIRYLGAIDTKSLSPGRYRVAAFIPNPAAAEKPHILREEFRVIKPR